MRKFLAISLLLSIILLASCTPTNPVHSPPLRPSTDRPPHTQEQEPSFPFFDPGVSVECLDAEAYNVFMTKNPSPPSHFFIKGRLTALGKFENLLAFVSPDDTESYENVTIGAYVYKLTDTACNETFRFGITPYGEEQLPTGTLPETEFTRVGTDALVSQNNVRRITNEDNLTCVLDLDGIRYTYGEDGNLEKIEWAYRGLLVSFSDFYTIPSDTVSASTVSFLLRTPTLTREMADQLNQNLIATLFPTAPET